MKYGQLSLNNPFIFYTNCNFDNLRIAIHLCKKDNSCFPKLRITSLKSTFHKCLLYDYVNLEKKKNKNNFQ